MEEPQEKFIQPTEEQIKEMEKQKEEMKKFFESQIDFLETQVKYERLVTEIEESHMRQVMARMKIGQMKAPDPKEKTSDPK